MILVTIQFLFILIQGVIKHHTTKMQNGVHYVTQIQFDYTKPPLPKSLSNVIAGFRLLASLKSLIMMVEIFLMSRQFLRLIIP